MSPDFLNLPEAKPYAIAQTEKNTNRIGIRPFKSGDPTKAPFSAANGPDIHAVVAQLEVVLQYAIVEQQLYIVGLQLITVITRKIGRASCRERV